MIASLLVILALTIFVFMFINVIGDVTTRIRLDQIARTYILKMESSGQLTAAQITEIQAECNQLYAVRQATNGVDSQIKVTWNKGTGSAVGYGDIITLTIQCPASVATLIKTDVSKGGEKSSTGNVLSTDRSGRTVYTITKQSTAKY